MKKFIIGASMLALSSVFVSADEILQSIPTSNFPINDTIADCHSTMTPIADGKCFVNLYDNADGIFFQILVKDHRLQQKFLHDGLTVYIDPKAKKNAKQYVQFPTLTPQPMMMPEGEHPRGPMEGDGQQEMLKEGARNGFGPRKGERRKRMEAQTDTTLFQDFRQDKRMRGPQDRDQHRERSRMLKMLVANMGNEVTTFNVKKNSSILDPNSCKVFVSGNDVVFTAYVPFSLIGKVNKKNTISLGICEKEKEEKTTDNDQGMPGPPPGEPGFGGPRPGGPMGMGGFDRQNSKQMLNSKENFATWVVFQIKNSSFTKD